LSLLFARPRVPDPPCRDRLAAELAEARKPLLVRVVEAIRRR
jgi:hypothetical protein